MENRVRARVRVPGLQAGDKTNEMTGTLKAPRACASPSFPLSLSFRSLTLQPSPSRPVGSNSYANPSL